MHQDAVAALAGEMPMESAITQKEYGEAYEKSRMQTVSFLISRGLNEDEAREKAQAAWAKGWERHRQLKDKTKALAWVNTIAFNLHKSSFRRDSRREPLREIAVQPPVRTATLDLDIKMRQCRKTDSEILKLRYLMGFDITDLADRYHCTQTTVRVKLMRARRSLKAQYPSGEYPA